MPRARVPPPLPFASRRAAHRAGHFARGGKKNRLFAWAAGGARPPAARRPARGVGPRENPGGTRNPVGRPPARADFQAATLLKAWRKDSRARGELLAAKLFGSFCENPTAFGLSNYTRNVTQFVKWLTAWLRKVCRLFFCKKIFSENFFRKIFSEKFLKKIFKKYF